MLCAGLTQQQAEDAGTSLLSIPSVTISEVTCGLEGEEGDVMEGDVVTCTAQVTLSRPSHSQSGRALVIYSFCLFSIMESHVSCWIFFHHVDCRWQRSILRGAADNAALHVLASGCGIRSLRTASMVHIILCAKPCGKPVGWRCMHRLRLLPCIQAHTPVRIRM